MRNDANLQARTSRAGLNTGFLSESIQAVCRSFSASASNLTATLHSARSSLVSTSSVVEDESQREQVQWANFDKLELGSAVIRHVILLAYLNGFQVWDVEEADNVRELVSKRDGPVAFLRAQPEPFVEASEGGLKPARPLLLVVTGDISNCISTPVPDGSLNVANGLGRPSSSLGGNRFTPTIIKFYSLRSHTYVHTLRFRTSIYAVRCSPRVVAVALISQLHCIDPATLQNTFSVLTYPSPQAGVNGLNVGYGAVAVGPRWLAYAANQPLILNTGRVSPEHLNPSPGVSSSNSPANGSLVVHYAKESSKQVAAGIVSLKNMGYKRWSKYRSERLTEACPPVMGSPSCKNSCNGSVPYAHYPEHAGTVIVRDFVSKTVVAQFRAHASPLSALCFDPSGTLLVTASIYGHSMNVFRIMPTANGSSSSTSTCDAHASYVHLYKLSRGLTDALIQDITFTEDSHWIVVSSSRGTSHLFAISPFGGTVGISTHGTVPANQAVGKMVSMATIPWWSNAGPVKSSQQSSLPPPLTVNLSVVSRIKDGSNGWCGAVSGGGRASNGRTTSSTGAVAVVFHDGGGQNLESEAWQNSLEEKLWVFSPSGHLTRYSLHLPAGMEGLYCNRIPSGMVIGDPCCPKEGLSRVVVQASQRWDVCRRPNWVEREERIDSLIAHDAAQDEANTVPIPSYGNGMSMGWCSQSGRDGREEMHQWFMSNAEVHLHHSREPIWAKSQVSFHVFIGAVKNELPQKGDFGGEKEIEKVQTRMVEVRKKDLLPVFDSLNDFEHSSNGICCGSEESSFTGANSRQNGHHPSYQDRSQDLQTVCLPHYLEQSTSFLSQTHQSRLYLEKANSQSGIVLTSDSIKDMKQASSGSLIGSPFVNIPKAGLQYAYEIAPRLEENLTVDDHVVVEGLHKKTTLPVNGAVEVPFVKMEHISIISSACEGQIKTGSSPHTNSTRSAVIGHFDPSVDAISNQCDVSATGGSDLQLLQAQRSGDSKQTFRRALNARISHARELHLQLHDVESSHENSRSADFEGEQGDAAQEGSVFPSSLSQDG